MKKLLINAEDLDRLIEIARDVTPDEMGGYPDLFGPEGYGNGNVFDVWDNWANHPTKAIVTIRENSTEKEE